MYFLIGAAIGAATSAPIGPVNVAVIDTAYRHTLRRALAVGLGGACGDGLYALVGIVGVGPLLDQNPGITPILFACSGVVLIAYGVLTARTRPAPAVSDVKERADHPSKNMWSGFWLGALLIVLNPAALVTWVIIVGSFMTDVTTLEGVSAALGVACGSLAWFTFVANLANHGKKVLGHKAVWVTRIVGVLLIGYGLYSLGRAAKYWFF